MKRELAAPLPMGRVSPGCSHSEHLDSPFPGQSRPILPDGQATHPYLQPVDLPVTLPTSVYGAMLVIWHLRPVLQKRFPIYRERTRDYLRFLAWCAAEGRRQYRALRQIPEWDAALAAPMELPVLRDDKWQDGYSVGMFLYGIAKQHYTLSAMLNHAKTRDWVAKAWWRGDRHKRHFPPLAVWQEHYMASRFDSHGALLEAVSLKRDMDKPVQERIETYELDGPLPRVGSSAMVNGDTSSPRRKVPRGIKSALVRMPRWASRTLWGATRDYRSLPSESTRAGVTSLVRHRKPSRVDASHPFGVNLYGYAHGEMGIGEDVRLVAQALDANGVPLCIVNIRPGDTVSQEDHSVADWVADEPKYAINLFCVTGIEQARVVSERGLELLDGRYNIGLWPWELPRWPKSCHYAYANVDEIWGISRYTAEAYGEAPCPVTPMTLPVTVEPITDEGRADFGLPDNQYLFYFSFDLNSTLKRKNPEGLISAFEAAFPRKGAEGVGLVLKASHVTDSDEAWCALKARIGQDQRIHLIDSVLRRPSLLALYRACDCFVSLHRAEGFGRGLAEALLLGNRVIATGYSGNMDYCDARQIDIVNHAIKAMEPGDYFHAEGQSWAEPDLGHAARLMREAYEQRNGFQAPGVDFSPASVGSRYLQRLEEIKLAIA